MKILRVNHLLKVTSRILFPLKHLSGRNRKIAIICSVFVILIMIPILFYTLSHLDSAEAAWWNQHWSFRQRVDITNSGTVQNDFQISITLDTASLISAGKVQSDCDDIRITNKEGKPLPYWTETGANTCNTSTTTIWTKVPTIPASGNTVYVYYGNPAAQNAQNGDKVFEFFDEFSGPSIDPSKWSQGTIGSTSGTSFSQSAGTLAGGNSNRYIQSVKSFTGNYEVKSRSYTTTDNVNGFSVVGFWGSTSNSFGILDHNNLSYYRNDSTWTQFAIDGTGQWTKNSAKVVSTTATYTRTGETSGSSSATGITNSGLNAENIRLGARYDSSATDQNFVATWDWVIVRKAAATEPTVGSPTNEEAGVGPIAWWKLDEGGGTIVHDSTQKGNDGSLSGTTKPSWQTKQQCFSGKCLYFDGSTSYVDMGNVSNIPLTGDLTISFWMKPTNIAKGRQNPIGKAYGGEFDTTLETNGSLSYYHGSGGGNANPYMSAGSGTNSITQNQWNYVVITRNNTTRTLRYYINGRYITQVTWTSDKDPSASSRSFKLGYEYAGYYQGFIDEVKMYNYVRTETQIKADLTKGGGVLGAVANQNLSDGLVGYWKMDESAANSCSGGVNDSCDSSGNGKDGAWNGDTTSAVGKFGNSVTLDGTGDYVSAATISIPTSVSAGAWVYSSNFASNMFVIQKAPVNAEWELFFETTLKWRGGSTTSISCTAPSNNQWHHVFGTQTGTTATLYIDGVPCATGTVTAIPNGSGVFDIGRHSGGGYYFNGKIDEARVYNRALSPSEVAQLYNFAPSTVAYWNFEEGRGTTLNDVSGNENNGTWSGTGQYYTQGKYGKGGSFNGTSDKVNVGDPLDGNLDLGNGSFTISTWVKTNYSGSSYLRLLEKYSGTGPAAGYALYTDGSAPGKLRVYIGDGTTNLPSTVNKIINDGSWHYFSWVVDKNSQTMTPYIDGVAQNWSETGTTTRSISTLTGSLSNSDSLYIGAQVSTAYFSGSLDEVKIYNYARTPGQIVEDMNAGHPLGGSPVGSQALYLKFDEGYGNTTRDSSVNNFSASLTNTYWTNDGKFGKAIVFNGSNAIGSISDTTNSALDVGHNTLTISAWVKPNTLGSATYAVINKNGPYLLWIDGTNKRVYTGLYNGTWYWATSSTNSLVTGQWQYIAMTYDGTNRKIYVNGKQSGSTDTQISGPLTDTNSAVSIGYDNCCARYYFDGAIDEVKIYNAALTASEIQLDYNRGASQVLGALSNTSSLSGGSVASNSASATYCIPGETSSCSPPVGEWNFDEGSGTSLYDSSGTGNTGTVTGSIWTQGKQGKGGSFNGTSSTFVNTPTTTFPTTNATVEFWAYPRSAASTSVLNANTDDTTNRFNIHFPWSDNNIYWDFGNISGGGRLSTAFNSSWFNQWAHYAFTVQSGVGMKIYRNGVQIASNGTTSTFTPGAKTLDIARYQNGVTYWNGKLDGLKIFNYARTPTQIAHDYNRGGPIGWWKFDECQGTTANDSSGNGASATLTIGATGSQTTAGTCSSPSDGTGSWYNGATGKFNSAFSTDGTNDYATATVNGQSASYVTVSLWTKINAHVNWNDLARHNWVGSGWWLGSDASGNASFVIGQSGVQTGSGTVAVSTGQWYHFVGVYDGSSVKFYVNGVLRKSNTLSNAVLDTTAASVSIGSNNTNALIDDVRVYNYPLSVSQIKQLYNQGGAVRFGPVTGNP